MGRSPMSSSSDESGVKKGPWTPEEDDKLINHIQKYGHGSWRALPKLAGLNRCGKSCRLRWTNYLRPDIKRGKFSQDEERTILHLHSILGNKWSAIASHLPGRTDNEIKNLWNTHLKKKLIQKGFDPMTHQPRTDIYSSFPTLIALANLIDNPASWEEQAMRLQAEALHMARLNHCFNTLLQPTSINISTPIQSHLPPAAFSLLKDALLLGHAPPPDMQFLSETAPFAHLPDLQAPCSDAVDQSCLSKGVTDFHQSFPATWMPPTLSPPPPPETSLTNTLDACSSSTYDGAAQIWSDLLDDPIFNDIA